MDMNICLLMPIVSYYVFAAELQNMWWAKHFLLLEWRRFSTMDELGKDEYIKKNIVSYKWGYVPAEKEAAVISEKNKEVL